MESFGGSICVIDIGSGLNSNRQLLYQPFTPYFVVFANIISDPNSADCFTDLQLLRRVVLYFLQMHNNHQSAKRLERVAETFTRLAEAYVRQSMQGTRHLSSGQEEMFESAGASANSETCHANTVHTSRDPSLSSHSTLSQHLSPTPFSQKDCTQFMSVEMDPDSMALLNFFSHSDSNKTSTDSFMMNNMGSPVHTTDFGIPQQSFSGSPNWVPDPVIRGLENIAQNYGLDNTFDWLSWDQYNVLTS